MKYDILGIGNAIMDIIAPVPESFLGENGIPKGAMRLIDQDEALRLDDALPMMDRVEVAGGSAANTIFGAAQYGVKTAYIGLTRNDPTGMRFGADMKAEGVDYLASPLEEGPATARCLIAVTPDGERSMNTFLGASVCFKDHHVQKSDIENAKIVYLEGYLFDSDDAKQAYIKASKFARESGAKIALTLSDLFCVERHRDDFRELVDKYVDILFANEAEIMALYETDDFETAVKNIRRSNVVAALTRSKAGSVIVTQNDRLNIPASPVDKVVDTTGAGDLYAAGFLTAYVRRLNFQACGDMGSQLASKVIQQYGARLP